MPEPSAQNGGIETRLGPSGRRNQLWQVLPLVKNDLDVDSLRAK